MLSSREGSPLSLFENAGAQLTALDLSSNNLNVIHSSMFAGLQSLRKLDLRNCNISSVERGAFNIKTLRLIYFSSNPLRREQILQSAFHANHQMRILQAAGDPIALVQQ